MYWALGMFCWAQYGSGTIRLSPLDGYGTMADSSGLTRDAIANLPWTQIETLCKIWGLFKMICGAMEEYINKT